MNRAKYFLELIKNDPKLLFVAGLAIFLLIVFLSLLVLTLARGSETKSLSEAKQLELQDEVDRVFSEGVETFYSNYPWYENLPPKNEKYFVAFDEAEQAFYVSLYVKNNPSLAEEYKKQLFLDLEQIGVATQSYEFNWFNR